ncbi:hypothetical protein N7471_003216 [Penicillium samsonianum]|uniref:uncharacterized protein n=1 Tax=Penicillium samsonianum TaxID=1882272 RepID=UPI002548DCC1|nr:uncharacterized protein N7471_003216 [Penicillium samsonianum]KAJ6143763.1 hypothetical protein N7471_003216 [Penicillium samsonianum]
MGFLSRPRVPAESQDDPKTFPSGIKLLYGPDDGNVDIIFIHGLTGDRDATWTARDATDPWPKTLLPPIIPTARVLAFGYDANVADWKGVVSQSRIANHAWNLLTALSTYRENDGTNERPIIFVCHSLGGLVCEDALFTSNQRPERHLRDILHSTRGIIFLGTPHHGAGLARWAEALSRSIGLVKKTNSEIVGVLKRDSEVLARIQDGFHTMVKARSTQSLPPIEITCFYEEMPLPGVGLVVPQDSAILPGYIPIGIHGNHMDMTKFAGSTDPGLLAVCGEMRRWIKDLTTGNKYHTNQPRTHSALDRQPGSANQSGENNRQYNSFGGTQKIADGNYYESKGDQHFGTVSPKRVHGEKGGIGTWAERRLTWRVVQNVLQAEKIENSYRRIPFPRNEDIVDRTDIVTKLDALFQSPKSHSAALWGLGGSGKTQVALEFAWRQSEDKKGACSVFWVHADTQATFAQDYKDIAGKLGLPDDLDGEKLLTAVRDCIESQPRWLLVLDNADDLAVFGVRPAGGSAGESPSLYTYVPQGASGTLLWTSRDKRIVGTLVGAQRGIQVGRMTTDESICLLGKLKNGEGEVSSGEESDARKLLEELQWLPLAISQASAYMMRTSMPIPQYLSRLLAGQERWRVLKAEHFDRHRRPDVPNSVLETWSISVERIRQDDEMAYRILHVIAYVNSQNIPIEIMAAVHTLGNERQEPRSCESQDRVMEAITRLREFSFLGIREVEGGVQQYEMHKLVQEATRYGLSVRSVEDATYFSNTALQIVTRLFPTPQPETWRECEKYVTHAVEVGKWAEVCERSREVSDLLTQVSHYYFDCGRWMDKQLVDERAYELRQQVFGDKDPDTIGSLENLALTYHAQGWYSEAELLQVKALELWQEVLGDKHPYTIRALANLAVSYHAQGRYSEAEPLQVKALELRQEVLGDKHPDTMYSLASLAATYHAQGRYREAEPLQVKALELRQEVLGDKHPDTIWNLANLAVSYHAQGRYSEAEPLQVTALELRQEVLGDKHPDTIWNLANLAVTYHAQGRYSEAEPLQVKALELRQEVLGDKHPHTIWNLANLAVSYHAQGRYSEAEPLQVKALELQQEVLGDKHPHTIRSLAHLAVTYHEQGRYSEAEPLQVKALELRQEVLGDKHPETMYSLANLAVTYHKQGRYSEAEPLQVKALELRQEVLGDKHPETMYSLASLAATYHAQGRYREAEPLQVKALELQQEVLGDKHPDTIWSLENLAATYDEMGCYREAENMRAKASELQVQELGDKTPDTI